MPFKLAWTDRVPKPRRGFVAKPRVARQRATLGKSFPIVFNLEEVVSPTHREARSPIMATTSSRLRKVGRDKTNRPFKIAPGCTAACADSWIRRNATTMGSELLSTGGVIPERCIRKEDGHHNHQQQHDANNDEILVRLVGFLGEDTLGGVKAAAALVPVAPDSRPWKSPWSNPPGPSCLPNPAGSGGWRRA